MYTVEEKSIVQVNTLSSYTLSRCCEVMAFSGDGQRRGGGRARGADRDVERYIQSIYVHPASIYVYTALSGDRW